MVRTVLNSNRAQRLGKIWKMQVHVHLGHSRRHQENIAPSKLFRASMVRPTWLRNMSSHF
jgi:hypothetical protein